MALNDVPLEDAGGDYYARQFDSRVRNIRKYGKAPPARNSGSRANGWAAGAGVVALLVVIRIIVAVVFAVSGSSSSDYNTYDSYQSPATPNSAPMEWNNNIQVEQQPWQVPPADIPEFQPHERMFPPDLEGVLDPNAPPAAPDDDRERPDKDD
jgi:hypothetical protein